MNLLQLVFKQMRQRALSTWLTLLSVLIAVALAVAVVILQRESATLFGQSDFGYDIIIGPPKGSPLQLTLNTVYHLDVSPGNIQYSLYEDMSRTTPAPPGRLDYRAQVKWAIPFMVGDSYMGRRLVGTSPQMFGFNDDGTAVSNEPFEYRKGRHYELAQGRVFEPRKFEAVIGSDAAENLHMKLGDKFRATHGFPGPNEKPDIHKPQWTVVGVLKPTHTANDRVLFMPIVSLYAIEEHDVGLISQFFLKANFDYTKKTAAEIRAFLEKQGVDVDALDPAIRRRFRIEEKVPTTPAAGDGELLKDKPEPGKAGEAKNDADEPDAYKLDAHGDIVPELPPQAWQLSAILVKSRGSGYNASLLEYNFKFGNIDATAVIPAVQMRQFFDTFLEPSTQVLSVIAVLVTVVAGVGILVSIYNSISARMREIAILRALGATRARILELICTEAALVGLMGAGLGLIAGHLVGAVESGYFLRKIGQSINWMYVSRNEVWSLVLAVGIAAVAGLVPALKAYRTPVAVNLVSG
jgi:putative ABC transport system permease protein